MAKKIILEDSQGNVLHSKTLGECVTMSNGENLDTLMSKSQMFTPTIAQDKSMFKVGTGVDVDYSANVKDGAYESLVFKGKSLVNLASEKTKSFTTSHFLRCTLSHELVNGKKYLLKWDITNNTIGAFDVRFLRTSDGVRSGAFTLNVPKVVTVTNDGFDAIEFFTNASFISQGLTATIDNIMVVEYVEGMENNISYFEGLCDVKMPILRNVGKNLIDGTGEYIGLAGVDGATGSNVLTGDGTLKRYSYIVRCKPNTTYTLSTSGTANRCGLGEFSEYPKLRAVGTKWGDANLGGTLTITTKPTTTYLVCYSYYSETVHSQSEMGEIVRGLVVQLEESSTATSYEDHKTNILRTSEEVILRSVGDTKDSYNALTGEYVQRIVEYVFNGSESEAWNFAEMKGDNYRFGINLPIFGNKSADKTALICDRLKVGDVAQEPKQEQITTYNHDSHFELRIALSPSTLASNNVGELRRYLQANPITIQYAVAEPTTVIIKPSTIPFAYANGHMVLESGSSEQSLLPHLKYSVVTGRTGQVTQNTKVLRKQEQQIIGLEELLLTQIVQMEYERTLLQFDYELQMMMLG